MIADKVKKFVYRIRTESGNLVGGVTVLHESETEADRQLRVRFPRCEILDRVAVRLIQTDAPRS